MCICVCGSLLTYLRSVRKFSYPRGIRVKIIFLNNNNIKLQQDKLAKVAYLEVTLAYMW